MTGIRVVVADDQDIVRDGLVTVLGLIDDFEVVAEAADGEQAVRAVGMHRPDVVLMDLRMPGTDGISATARIAAEFPATRVLVLTTFDDDESITLALQAGARGYLTKDAGRAQLASAIRALADGQQVLGDSVGRRLIERLSSGPADPLAALRTRFPELTRREAEVAMLVAADATNGEIAQRLYISPTTVKSHINALFAKLGVKTRAEAVAVLR
ncbi:response regulator transcription factor [Microbacterium sp. KUDC0406]|uniref:response regulator transcription factor n=1 Tax=Microbacterium sp. KUDC0406 TaxID=2909588 RepID=UPI001F30C50A|nr:response regulator transcription factor [Microbacterium sp. KUDC0406]UJP09864.1 response regulator transcription factor [Microbacterium sp. KUDC0406]